MPSAARICWLTVRLASALLLYRALRGRGEAGITVELTVNRQGEQHEIGVKTIDRYRYLKLGTTY